VQERDLLGSVRLPLGDPGDRVWLVAKGCLTIPVPSTLFSPVSWLEPQGSTEGRPCLGAIISVRGCWGGTLQMLPETLSLAAAAAKAQVKHRGLRSFI